MKQKTHKGTAKRFWTTGSGKLMRRKSGQDHFNARQREKVRKIKRKAETVSKTNPRLKLLIPYK
jgi:large subunit ribosomal protein L35